MNHYIQLCKYYAKKAFEDKWIKNQICSDIEHLSGFKGFSKKAIELFEYFGFIDEAIAMKAQVESEVARINLLMEQQALLSDCKAFLESSQVERGLTMKNLEALQERGTKLLKVFDTFDYNVDKRFRIAQQDMTKRLGEIRQAMNDLKAELAQAWDAIYGIETVDDARHVSQLVSSLLAGGLAEKDREDFENIDKFIRQFLVDIQALLDCEDSLQSVDETYQRLTGIYSEDSELDFTALIENTYNNRLERLKELDSGWKKKYIEIDIASMDQHQLDQWKRDAQPWPAFLSKETQEAAVTVLHCVEEALSRQRLNYIVSLIDQLTAEEKEKLLKMLR